MARVDAHIGRDTIPEREIIELMLAEWSVECAPDDPLLVVPWSDESDLTGKRHFVDLRENPYDIDHLPEAELYPPLMQALRALNANRSPVFTAKCDAWTLDAEELANLKFNLGSDVDDCPVGFASYIDLVWRERSIFTSFHQTEQVLHRLTRRAAPLDFSAAMLDCVLRPAMVDLTGPQEGFAVSLYVKAVGQDPQTASVNWAAALEAIVAVLRGKDFLPA
jgi:hypothetical protein